MWSAVQQSLARLHKVLLAALAEVLKPSWTAMDVESLGMERRLHGTS